MIEEEVSLCGEPFQLLVLVSYFTVYIKYMANLRTSCKHDHNHFFTQSDFLPECFD